MKKQVGKFILLNTIGRGSFGKVKLAYHEDTEEEFAVKVMKKRDIRDRVLTEHVRKEISSMSLLEHPSIVKLHQVLTTRQHIYIVMELVTGGELWDEIMSTNCGGLPEWEARRYFRQLINGVHHCHSRGVYHRDLKPENLLLDDNACLKITDFGLSTLKQGLENSNDVLHTQCGTPEYAAPEIVKPPKDGYSGAKVDIWSCGVILYVMVASFMPFQDNDVHQMFARITSGAVEYPQWFSPALVHLLSRLFCVDHRERASLEEICQHPWFTYCQDPTSNGFPVSSSLASPERANGQAAFMDSPLLAKTRSVKVDDADQDVDAASDMLPDRQASDFTDYTLDLSISDFGKIYLRDKKIEQRIPEIREYSRERSHSDTPKKTSTPVPSVSSTSRRASDVRLGHSRRSRNGKSPLKSTQRSQSSLDMVRSSAPSPLITPTEQATPSSSSDSEDGATGVGSNGVLPQSGSGTTNCAQAVQCVICGLHINQTQAKQLQHICDSCYEQQMQKKHRRLPHRHTLSSMPQHTGGKAETVTSMDHLLFRLAAEREQGKRPTAAEEDFAIDDDDRFELDSNASFHMTEAWEGRCLEELEEHGIRLQKLNRAWANELQDHSGTSTGTGQQPVDHIRRATMGSGQTDARSLGDASRGGAEVKSSTSLELSLSSTQNTILRNPSRPWLSPESQRIVSRNGGQTQQSTTKNVLRDPFVLKTGAPAKGVSEHRSRLFGTDFLPDPCRDQALQEIATTRVQSSGSNTGPIAPPGSSMPRMIEGLRTLKHRGQQRKVFDSLCRPSPLVDILKQVLDEMNCHVHIRCIRTDGYKISTTMRPPEVLATLSTKIEVYRKSDALSKVSARKTKGSRQDFLAFFAQVKDRYAQSARNLDLLRSPTRTAV